MFLTTYKLNKTEKQNHRDRYDKYSIIDAEAYLTRVEMGPPTRNQIPMSILFDKETFYYCFELFLYAEVNFVRAISEQFI